MCCVSNGCSSISTLHSFKRWGRHIVVRSRLEVQKNTHLKMCAKKGNPHAIFICIYDDGGQRCQTNCCVH